jgi:uncharacterized membrane protein YhaH (DUF805 family)
MRASLSAVFSFRGRIGRGQYWLRTLLCLLILVLGTIGLAGFGILVNAGPSDFSTFAAVPIFMVFFLAMWVAIAVAGVRRLHDRGKTGFWLMLYYAGPMWVTKNFGLDVLGIAFMVIALGIVVWSIIDLGIMRGDAGANAYGPDPLAPPANEPEPNQTAASG